MPNIYSFVSWFLKINKRFQIAFNQVGSMKKAVVAGKQSNGTSTSNLSGMRRELLRLPDSEQKERSNAYNARDNDDFISSESDRQLLLMR